MRVIRAARKSDANTPGAPLRHHDNRVTKLYNDDVVYANDWFSVKWVHEFIERYGCPGAIIADVEGTIVDLPVPFYYFPDLGHGILNYIRGWAKRPWQDTIETTACFNFSIMKKKIDRYLLLKIIEWFKLDSYVYTWSGEGREANLSNLFVEMDSITSSWMTPEFRGHLLQPVTIDSLFYPEPRGGSAQYFLADQLNDRWEAFLHKFVPNAAVTILTESSSPEYEPIFSFADRTTYILIGLNFPIWAGGYGSAQMAKSIGIDIFEDVINHDYQYKPTLLERVYHAVADNLEILSNFDYACEMRKQCLPRLVANRNYALYGGLEQRMVEYHKTLPDLVKSVMTPGPKFDMIDKLG